jgi:hypothetical protein
MKPYIQTVNGRAFDFTDMSDNVLDIYEIGTALSKLCRYTGHCNRFYSVAQHSILVSHLVPPEIALEGLLHDAAEAYLGDVSSPLKQLLPEYQQIESRVEDWFIDTSQINIHIEGVKKADLEALALEKLYLLPNRDDLWEVLQGVEVRMEHAPLLLCELTPEQAEHMFHARYLHLAQESALL